MFAKFQIKIENKFKYANASVPSFAKLCMICLKSSVGDLHITVRASNWNMFST